MAARRRCRPLAAAGSPSSAHRDNRKAEVAATCQYCHATLPRHVSLATYYATCSVLAYCLRPASPSPDRSQISEAEKASRADEQHEIVLARARRKAEKHN
jgi:hypothetical protein